VVGGGGGINVAAADACERIGLSIPLFSAELQKKLASMLPPVGTSVRNPVDVASPFPPPAVLRAVMETVFNEGGVDTIILDEIEFSAASAIMRPQPERSGSNRGELAEVPVDVKRRLGKPIVVVLPIEATSADATELEGTRRHTRDYYLGEGIPVFLTLERAAKALINMVAYYERHSLISSSNPSKQDNRTSVTKC
jgi:acyl-CoA synthetase (NDP forming)